jgi:Glycosyltransferase like family
MIVFGCSVSEPEPYLRYAGPGIKLAAEPDSEILALAATDTLSRSYNLILDTAAKRADLEALVLLHPHAEIADPDLCAKVREALADPEVAAVGCLGSSGVDSIAWWEGAVVRGAVTHAYHEHGGGSFPAFEWTAPARPPAKVDAVDGFVLALSPWAVRNIRFDEQLVLGHGYDVDYCLQVRAAGRTVAVSDLRVIEHRALDIISDLELWVESHIALARKWEGRVPGRPSAVSGSAKERARRAEAERECARAVAYFKRLGYDARVQALQRALEQTTATPSWRLTEPLRALNRWRRRLRAQRAADLVLGDHRLPPGHARPDAQPRQPLGDREGA